MEKQNDVRVIGYATIKQVAAAWQCSENTVRKLANAREIPSVKFGRLVRFPLELLEGRQAAIRGGKLVQVRG